MFILVYKFLLKISEENWYKEIITVWKVYLCRINSFLVAKFSNIKRGIIK